MYSQKQKDCLNNWRKNNPDKVRQQWIRQRKKLKLLVLSQYSGGSPTCVRCGITDIDVLCIDHINNNGNVQRAKDNTGLGQNFYKWLKRNNYPEGYQVLCWNCNIKKRITEGCK